MFFVPIWSKRAC